MIFVTVGTQLPFDRLIGAVDAWAGAHPAHPVVAQVGPTALVPRHIAHERSMSPAACRERMLAADVVVAHAGMGTILGALELGKPLLVMPRRAALGEHRNDHQLSTARRLAELGRVEVAFDVDELGPRLDDLGRLQIRERISPYAPEPFLSALRQAIDGAAPVLAG